MSMEYWLVFSVVSLMLLALAVVFTLKRGRKKSSVETDKIVQLKPSEIGVKKASLEPEKQKSETKEAEPEVSNLSEKLSRTRGVIFGRFEKYLSRRGEDALKAQEWEEIEEALLEADVGITTTTLLLNQVRQKLKSSDGRSLKELMRAECKSLLDQKTSDEDFFNFKTSKKPYVISIVGVNGVGKTTTTGKLAHLLHSRGHSVLLGAADTFRAAAIAQLKIWAERASVQIVTGREGADPGSVAFDSLTAAKAREIDVVLIDTAGRLHTKIDLMDELKKVIKVMKKVIPDAPHETWLVLDGTLGQNSVQQAREFKKALELTGVIITKLDGTAKGGALLSITSELNLPVRFIGIGEGVNDFIPFDSKNFIDAILGE